MKSYIIYKITNITNGKLYIGQTCRTIERRKHFHWRDTFMYNSNCVIHNSMRKYGMDNFLFEILFNNLSKKEADAKEKETIKLLKTKRPHGYNLTDGGEGCIGYRHTEEAKKKVSVALTGRKMSDEEKERRKLTNPHTKMSEEHKKKLIALSTGRIVSEKCKEATRLAHIGKKASEETKLKMSISHKGKKFIGRKTSEEGREKLRIAQSKIDKSGAKNPMYGKTHSVETKTKMSIAHKGRIFSIETREKLSLSQKGRKFTPEHIANLRASQLLRREREKLIKLNVRANND